VTAAFLGVLAAPAGTVAAQAPPQFVAIDIGTLGGPNTYFNTPGNTVTDNGTVLSSSDTLTPDPATCFGGPLTQNGYEWRNGVTTELAPLPRGANTLPFSLSPSGITAGMSDNCQLDPLTGFPEVRAAIWQAGHVTDLGTLGGNESTATFVNGRGQVAGQAANAIPDPFPFGAFGLPWATQSRAFLWQGGVMHDLGTLGGPDAAPTSLNDRGEVAGISFTNFTPNPTTGVPTQHPFLWQNGHMRDLGSLGGTLGFATWMNNVGDVVGASFLAGDQTFHPFLWNGSTMVDLGTLGGPWGYANWISSSGDVTGSAAVTPDGSAHHAFLWKNGTMTDLVPVEGAPCSNGIGINSRGQVVGSRADCHGTQLGAMLWYHGSAFDLNTLIGPSPLHLMEADYVNNRGEIACAATLPNGDLRIALLVPAGQAAKEGLKSNVPAFWPAKHATARSSNPARRAVTSLLGGFEPQVHFVRSR
jgi:probable HAF family extracellular repeat protein